MQPKEKKKKKQQQQQQQKVKGLRVVWFQKVILINWFFLF